MARKRKTKTAGRRRSQAVVRRVPRQGVNGNAGTFRPPVPEKAVPPVPVQGVPQPATHVPQIAPSQMSKLRKVVKRPYGATDRGRDRVVTERLVISSIMVVLIIVLANLGWSAEHISYVLGALGTLFAYHQFSNRER